MRIINGKYRIDKLISNSRSYSMYEAIDITKNKRKVNIYILNSIHVEKTLLEMYIKEFEKTSLLSDSYINILEFGSTVNSSSKEKKVEYFYATESISDYKSLMDMIDEISVEVLLDIFVKICKLAQEQCYSYIKTMPFSLESIYVSSDNRVKMKDKITALLDCRELGIYIHYDSNDNYKDSVFSNNKTNNEKYYVEKLREILISMVLQNKGVKIYGKIQHDIDENLNGEKRHEYLQLIGEKMSTLIYNLHDNNIEKGKGKILNIIDEINKIFNTTYNYISRKKEKLNFNTPLIGRNEEVSNIIKSINEGMKEKINGSVILIHGEIGIGKTRLITHVKHLIDVNYKNILKCFYVTDYGSSFAISNLLKQVVASADKGLLNKYKKELSMVIPEIYGEETIDTYGEIELKMKSNVALMAKISLFLLEYYSEKPGVIIFDNVHMYDNFTLGIIQYVLSRVMEARNISVIISYRDGDCLGNYDFTEMLTKINSKVDLEIHLTPLNEDMTSRILKNVLNVDRISESFTDLIYRHSMGNPLLVEEGIKYLRDKKVVYIDETDGMWKKISNHEIYMSTDMEEVCRNQLLGLKEEYLEILYDMSYFYMPVSLSIIVEFLNPLRDNLKDSLAYLIAKGILSSTQNHQGTKYTFYNKFLKNYLYRSIDEKVRFEKHVKIAQILMSYDKKVQGEYIDEIIYHLEKVEDKRILEFYKSREKELESLNKIEESIKFNFKILNFIQENKDSEKLRKEEIAVNMRLGELYNKVAEKKTSIDYYLYAKNLCNKEKYINEYIDILREILFLSIDLGYEKYVTKYLKEMRAAVEKSDYRIGKIKYLLIIIWRKYNKQEYEKVKELCNYGISLCEEEDEEYRLAFMNYYIDVLIAEGNEVEGLELLKPMVEKCEKLNFTKRLCRITNSMGVLYSDYLQLEEEALEWFEKSNTIGMASDDDSYKVNSLSNLGFVHYIMLNYSKAYEYFNASSNHAMESEVLGANFYNFSYIGTILYKIGKYNESYKYVKLCKHYIDKDYMKYWQEAGPYCIFMYLISDLVGNKEEGKKYLEQGFEILGDSKSIMGYEISLLYNIYRLCYERSKSDISSVINSAEKILYLDFRISMLCYCINKLIYLGFEEDAIEIYKYIIKYRELIKSDINKVEIEYLEVVLRQGISYKKLVDSLEVLKDKNLILSWKINFQLAKGYYGEENYTYAAEYIYECCGLIINTLEGMPNNEVGKYIKINPDIIQAFELLMKVRQHYGAAKASSYIEVNISKVKNIVLYLKGIMKPNIVNATFLKELKKQNKDKFEELDTIDNMIGKLSGDINENLNTICKYINLISVANRATILLENEGKIKISASTDENIVLPDDLSLINMVRSKKKPLISKDKRIVGDSGEVLSYDIDNNNKTTMCIPITQILKSGRVTNSHEYTNELVGYIYVESTKRINNININTMKKCSNISRILYMIIDRENIRRSSSIDNLTSALMRKHLELFIQEQIEKSYTYGTEFSIIMLDIDKFKEINDNYGHRMGDKVLSKLCKTVLNNIRKSDVIGRYGGEEFIIVLPNIGVNDAEIIAERIRNKIIEEKLMGDKREVTVSMGVANYPKHATTYDELIEKSDQALYEAKNGGRNRTKVWNESFGYKISTTNRLSGIFVGNGDQDYKNVSIVMEFIDLMNDDTPIKDKVVNAINRISEITEADSCILYIINNNEIVTQYCKISEKCGDIDEEYNISVVKSAIKSNENICGIDWNCINQLNKSMAIPDIKSNMVVLLKNKKDIIGAIHLSSSINHKEFNYDQLNYINTLAKIMVPMLEEI